jgi:hypothetical protein
MNPKDYPNWLKNKISEYTSGKLTEEETIEYTNFEINGTIFRKWIETQNPLFVWKAFGLALKHGLDIPKWVRNYLIECSDNLLKISPTIGENAQKEVFKVFGMSKRGVRPAFSKYNLIERQEKVWAFVEHYREAHPKASLAETYFEVSKIFNLGEVAIQKDHEKYRKFILKGDNEFPNHS